MKKVLSFVAAAAVTLTSFASLVSAAPNDFGVEDTDSATVTLDIKTKWSGDTDYDDHKNTSAKPAKSVTRNRSASFDSRATLDMTNVAAKWHEFKQTDRAQQFDQNSTVEHALAKAVTLTGEYTLKITRSSNAITNEELTQDIESALTWVENDAGYTATDFFEYDSGSIDGNTLTIVYKVKDKSDDLNSRFDDYFEGLYAADNGGTEDGSNYDFILDIDDSAINPPSAGTTYSVTGTFSGYVDIDLPTILSPTPIRISHVDFTETSDTEYMRTPSTGGNGGGGGGTIRTTPTPNPTEIPAATEQPTATPIPADRIQNVTNSKGASLNTEDHYAYIIGYPIEDGSDLAEVRPQASITRAEVATIFFRLLTDESRARFWTQDNDFADVEPEAWYNNAISTAQNAGIIEGDNGLFRPNDAITRAEFATIAARFSSVVYDGEDKFSDISGHWAREYINKAAETGWITGDGDGTFRPDDKITRAEAMTLVNRMLYRIVENSSLDEDGMLVWIDNMDKTAWYYAAVQEATNSHNYDREAIGYVESWTGTKAPRDWEALEKEYSTPASAGEEESVFADSNLTELDTEQAAAEADETAADEAAADEAAAEDAEATEAPAE